MPPNFIIRVLFEIHLAIQRQQTLDHFSSDMRTISIVLLVDDQNMDFILWDGILNFHMCASMLGGTLLSMIISIPAS